MPICSTVEELKPSIPTQAEEYPETLVDTAGTTQLPATWLTVPALALTA